MRVGWSIRCPDQKLANGKRKQCDIMIRIAEPKQTIKIAHGQADRLSSTDRARLRRRNHHAADDALAVASRRRAKAVTEDIGSLRPRRPPMPGLSRRALGYAGDACALCRA